MSGSMVRRWVRLFNEGRENVHDDERSGRPSLVNDKMVRAIEERIRGDRQFTITMISQDFPEISRSLLHEIVWETCLSKTVCTMGPEATDRRTQNEATCQCFGFFDSLQRARRRLPEPDRNRRRNMGITHNSWNQTPIDGVEAHVFTSKDEIQKDHFFSENHVHCLLGQERSFTGGFHASGYHYQLRSLLRNAEEATPRDSEQATRYAFPRHRSHSWQCSSAHGHRHAGTSHDLQMGTIWSSTLQSGPRAKRLPPFSTSEIFPRGSTLSWRQRG